MQANSWAWLANPQSCSHDPHLCQTVVINSFRTLLKSLHILPRYLGFLHLRVHNLLPSLREDITHFIACAEPSRSQVIQHALVMLGAFCAP
jgi:hypothetical protein